MRTWFLLAVAATLAGCSSDPDVGGAGDVDGDGMATSSTQGLPRGEEGMHELNLVVTPLEEGTVEVPLPTGLWCVQVADFRIEASAGLTAEVVDSDRGQVLRVSGSPGGDARAIADLAGREPCTPQADAWSIDPDPAQGSIAVNADQPMDLRIFLVDEDASCHRMTVYGGQVPAGWSELAGTEDGSCG